jgi:hypothetical protein
MPRIRRHSIHDIGNDFSGEALHAIRVDNGKGDRVFGLGDNSEISPVPTVRAAVKRVIVVVLVRQNVVRHAINLEGAASSQQARPPNTKNRAYLFLIRFAYRPGTPPKCGCCLSVP